jgi:electron transfer flavoprotein-quinone oxidoreductase
VVMKDLKKYRKVPEVLEGSPDLLSLYPKKVNRLMIDFFTVGSQTKSETQKRAIKAFLTGLPKFKAIRDLIRARHLA